MIRSRISLGILTIMSLLLCCIASVASSQDLAFAASSGGGLQVNRRWHVLRVDGKGILDENGYQVFLRGFSLWKEQVFLEQWKHRLPLTVENFRQLKSWGFNVITPFAWWGKDIEPSKDKVGVYSETNLEKLETVVENAQEAGLYVIIGLRVQHEQVEIGWDGWAEADMLLTPEGLQRYSRMLEMIVQRFDHYPNVIGYIPWHFPWHGFWDDANNTMRAQKYYQTTTPAMVDSIRRHSSKIIFYSPFHHGTRNGVDTGEFESMSPINDPLKNVVYTHDGHKPSAVEWPDQAKAGDPDYPNWSGNVDFIKSQLSYARDFADKYDVPMMLSEFGLNIAETPRASVRPIPQSRLDCLDAKLSILDEYGYNWLYWFYSNYTASGVLESDLSPSAVLPVLQKHASLTPVRTIQSSMNASGIYSQPLASGSAMSSSRGHPTAFAATFSLTRLDLTQEQRLAANPAEPDFAPTRPCSTGR
jgi:hypothetical protein